MLDDAGHLRRAASGLLRAVNHVEQAAADVGAELPAEVRLAAAVIRNWCRRYGASDPTDVDPATWTRAVALTPGKPRPRQPWRRTRR